MKNIYGEPLKKCQKYSTDYNGSWDKNGYCSEKDGGVHQICFNVKKDSQDFSKNTGQSDWSTKRVNKNHCMCLGAWSLYKAKQNNGQIRKTRDDLNCESIPEMSLNDNYVSNWNTWNGLELPNQIVDGVNSIMKECYDKGDKVQRENLRYKYINLTKNRPEFHNTNIYKKYSKF